MTNVTVDDIIIQAYSENDFESYFQMQLENKIYEHFGKEMIRNVLKSHWLTVAKQRIIPFL